MTPGLQPSRLLSLSVGFSRQEYWSGLPFPSPGDLSDPGVEPMSLALAGGFFTTEPPGKPEAETHIRLNLSASYRGSLGEVIQAVQHQWPREPGSLPSKKEI